MIRRIAIFVLLAFLFIPLAAQAEEPACVPGNILPPCTCSGDCQFTDFVQLFVNLYAFGVHLAAPLAIFFIIIGGVVLVTASGYSNRVEMGKTMITQAVTGLIIVLISWVIVDTAIFLLTGNRDHTVLGKPWFSTSFNYVCDEPPIYNGCSGGNVSSLQAQLVELGYAVTVDGSFGPQTAAAVRQFQKDANNNVYVTNATLACSGRTGGIVVWNAAFEKDCDPPGGVCGVSDDEVDAHRLPITGTADQRTLDSLTTLTASTEVADAFKAVCRS